jgi:hypothetical protein
MLHSGEALARDVRAYRAASRMTGEVYSTLINLSGRRRFTSQRLVLYAVLAAQGRDGALQISKDALATFRDAHKALVEGNAELPGVFCDELHEAYFGTEGSDETIRAFIVLAERTHEAIASGARAAQALLDQLVDSGTPLLAALNSLTQLYETLARRHSAQARKQLVGVMSDIESIAKQARIVAFNAQIVASRAGPPGREFSVVAAELSRITSHIDELVREALRNS